MLGSQVRLIVTNEIDLHKYLFLFGTKTAIVQGRLSVSFSSQLTNNNPQYARPYGSGSNYYYDAIEVIVLWSGSITFTSSSTKDLFGYIYDTTFDPFYPLVNLLDFDDDSADGYEEFKIQIRLRPSQLYILVVTTYDPNVKGAYQIKIAGANGNIQFNKITSSFVQSLIISPSRTFSFAS